MNEKDLFKSMYSKLHASENMEKEILAMHQEKVRKRLRPVWVAALCVCVLTGGALTVNAATGGELFQSIVRVVNVTENHEVRISFGESPGSLPEASLPEVAFPREAVEQYVFGAGTGFYVTEGGEAWLITKEEEKRNLTQPLREGAFAFTFEENGKTVSAGVELVQNPQGGTVFHLYREDEEGKSEGWIGEASGYQQSMGNVGNDTTSK